MIRARFRISYPGFLLDTDVTLSEQGITVLFGRSGSGKTTMLRAIAGIEHSPEGFFSIGEDIWQDATHFVPVHKRSLGYVFQESNLFPHLNVENNLLFGMRRCGKKKDEHFDVVIDLLGIKHLLERNPERLSGGEKQRIAIGRALLTSPRLLLMDEPLASLDGDRKKELLPYLEKLPVELGIPIIYVTHSTDEVVRLANDLFVLENGRIVASGSLSDTLSRLDLPIQLGEEMGVVLEGKIATRDVEWSLVRVDFSGGKVWTRDLGHTLGATVRIRVLARDVSLSKEEQSHSSIANHLPAVVTNIGKDEHPALCIVRLQCGDSAILARITHRSLARMSLAQGDHIWAQIKAVALL